jgi:hypothetical protein
MLHSKLRQGGVGMGLDLQLRAIPHNILNIKHFQTHSSLMFTSYDDLRPLYPLLRTLRRPVIGNILLPGVLRR